MAKRPSGAILGRSARLRRTDGLHYFNPHPTEPRHKGTACTRFSVAGIAEPWAGTAISAGITRGLGTAFGLERFFLTEEKIWRPGQCFAPQEHFWKTRRAHQGKRPSYLRSGSANSSSGLGSILTEAHPPDFVATGRGDRFQRRWEEASCREGLARDLVRFFSSRPGRLPLGRSSGPTDARANVMTSVRCLTKLHIERARRASRAPGRRRPSSTALPPHGHAVSHRGAKTSCASKPLFWPAFLFDAAPRNRRADGLGRSGGLKRSNGQKSKICSKSASQLFLDAAELWSRFFFGVDVPGVLPVRDVAFARGKGRTFRRGTCSRVLKRRARNGLGKPAEYRVRFSKSCKKNFSGRRGASGP